MANDLKLFDVLTRHQIYLEGVKVDQARQFNNVLVELDKEFKILFSELEFETLDALTKTQLRRFLVKLREAQSEIYTRYTSKLINDIKAFMSADVDVTKDIFETTSERDIEDAYEEGDGVPILGLAAFAGDPSGDERLWGSVTNAPLPANGVLMLPFIAHFTNSASNAVENIVRKGYANKWTKEETIRAIRGTKARNFRDGEFAKLNRQSAAVISTALQHVSSFVQAGIGSIFYDRYVWNSVLDGGTTEICLQRNGKIYRFGFGPLPPAHVGCRSTIWPIGGNENVDLIDVTYYSWLKSQPLTVQNDILGRQRANALRKGILKSKDFPKFVNAKSLDVNEFKNKSGIILTKG